MDSLEYLKLPAEPEVGGRRQGLAACAAEQSAACPPRPDCTATVRLNSSSVFKLWVRSQH